MLTAAEARSIWHYDAETGSFFWRFDANPNQGIVAGSKAGTPHRCGIEICYKRKKYRAHRLAWLMTYGEWPLLIVDHKSCDPSDNRISNLRLATPTQSVGNTRRSSRKKIGAKGIYPTPSGKWTALIGVNRKQIYLGTFTTAIEAEHAYLEAAKRHFGEFARAA